MTSFNYKLIQIFSHKETVVEEAYCREMDTDLTKMLKLLTITHKCITLQLEETMTNPKSFDSNKKPHPSQNCSVCEGNVIGKEFKKEEVKNLLFTVFTASLQRGGIKGQ